MIYLDYAANTPVDDRVLDKYIEATKKYIANPNSSHPLGKLAKKEIDKSSEYIANYFKTKKENIIYTSGSSESNNLIIKGIAEINKHKGNKIIISEVEHSSIIAPCNYLASLGYDIEIIHLTKEGIIDLKELEKTIDDQTILVSICAVDSELGTIQPIDKIGNIVSKYPNCVFHTDATQAVGKIDIDYSNVDFITLAPHKFYGLNGFGALINRNNIKLIPLIHGGKSTTIYRSGTPVTANVVALKTAIELSINNLTYNLIISDIFTGRKFFNKDIFDFLLSDKIKNTNLELPNFTSLKEKIKKKNITNSMNIIKERKEKEENITLYKLKFKNIINRYEKSKFIKMMLNKYNKFEIFSMLIKKIIMIKFRNQIFICFKSKNETLNLDKLNFIKYNTLNNTCESFILKEKYVKDEENIKKNNKIKPFTVIKLNKYTPGDSSKSKFFAELLSRKDTSHLGTKIQDKLNEIKNKIKEYEDFNALIQNKFFNKDII